MENSKENELYEKLFEGIEKGIEEAVGKTELDDLMEKIYTSIDMSNEKQDRINNKEEELKNEVRPVMIEEGKEELKELVEDKKEFDEMTKNAMIQAKLDIIEAREELQKYYVENTSKLLKKQEIVEKRLKDAKIARNLSDEKLIHAEIIANKTIEDIQNELKDTEKYYSKQIGILDGYEYDINNSEIGMTITEEEVESAKKIREPEIQEPDQEQEPTQQPTQGQQKPGQKPVQQPTQGQQQLNPRAVPEIIFGRKTTIKDNEKNIEWSSSNNKRNEITNKNFGELKEWLESDEIKNKFEENKFVIDSILLKGLVNALEQKIIGLEEVKNAITAMMNRNKKVLENIIKIRYDKSDLSKWTFPWNKKNRDIVAQSADRYERTAEVVGEYEPNPFKRLLKRMKIRALPAGKNE